MVKHLDISGYAGAGKTTISTLLASRHVTLWIPRVTSRPPRKGENLHGEYKFVSPNEFAMLLETKKFVQDTIHPVQEKGISYLTGIFKQKYWPRPTEDTELMLSVFGSKAPVIKVEMPEMITILLKLRNEEELQKRLVERSRRMGLSVLERWTTNVLYKEIKIEKYYDFVVYNDGTPEKCVRKIEKIAGLHSPRQMIRPRRIA